MSDTIKAARIVLGQMFRDRREGLGLAPEILAGAVGITVNTVKGIETARFAWDIDTYLRMCQALSIKPYFAPINDHAASFMSRPADDIERYHGFYTANNEELYPGQLAIVKLTHPRLFIRFNYANGATSYSFEEWKSHLVTVEWLDPDDTGRDNEKAYLVDCWNFLYLWEDYQDSVEDEDGD